MDTSPQRSRDPVGTRRNILEAALLEFSDNGLSGARVQAIADRTRTTVRMIYYYFGSKEGLYRSVLEQSYGQMRAAEAELRLQDLPPEKAIRRLVEFAFDHHEANPRFVRMVAIENIHRAEHINLSESIRMLNRAVIETIASILERGRLTGDFRADAAPLAVHLLITSFSFFRVANRYTLGAVFGEDPLSPAIRDNHREMAVSSVLGYLRQKSVVSSG